MLQLICYNILVYNKYVIANTLSDGKLKLIFDKVDASDAARRFWFRLFVDEHDKYRGRAP